MAETKKTTKKTTKKATTTKKTAPKGAAPKKTTKKGAAKKTAPKAPAKKTAPAKKDGLRKPQMRILKALAKKAGQSRADLAESAPVDVATCVEYIGSHDPERRAANDKKHFPSLLSLGYVKAEQHDVDGKDVIVYSLTASGKKVAANLD